VGVPRSDVKNHGPGETCRNRVKGHENFKKYFFQKRTCPKSGGGEGNTVPLSGGRTRTTTGAFCRMGWGSGGKKAGWGVFGKKKTKIHEQEEEIERKCRPWGFTKREEEVRERTVRPTRTNLPGGNGRGTHCLGVGKVWGCASKKNAWSRTLSF